VDVVYRILRRIFGFNKQEVTMEWRKLSQTYKARSLIILAVTKYYWNERIENMKLASLVGVIDMIRNAWTFLVNLNVRGRMGDPKAGRKEIGREGFVLV
jgi:hypothetical protein